MATAKLRPSINVQKWNKWKDMQTPVLKTNSLDEYLRWKRTLDCWRGCAQLDASTQAAQILMNGNQNPEINNIAVFMPKDMAYKNEAAENPQARRWILKSKHEKWKELQKKKRGTWNVNSERHILCGPIDVFQPKRKKKGFTIFRLMIKQTSLL